MAFLKSIGYLSSNTENLALQKGTGEGRKVCEITSQEMKIVLPINVDLKRIHSEAKESQKEEIFELNLDI